MAKCLHLLRLFLFSLTLIYCNATNPEISESKIVSLGHIYRHSHLQQRNGDNIIQIYELRKGNFSVKLTDYGATVMSVILPDKFGKLADVVLGYESVKEYVNDSTYFGAIVGRVANRIGGAQYTYEGKQYKLLPNEGKNILHGGPKGFSRVLWNVEKHDNEGPVPYITFTYYSVDGEEGFPGALKVKVTYKIQDHNKLTITMTAKPLNKPTPVNLAQHTYWNLGGYNSGPILDHTIQIFGSSITPVDENLIPTGKLVSVKGTPYDFLEPHTIGSKIKGLTQGYDINYVLNHNNSAKKVSRNVSMKRVAIVKEKKSGRVMELWTNKPGVQFYTSNTLYNVTGKGGYVYGPHDALCLETQGFPDAVNHPNFPSVIVSPGQVYEHIMVFTFSTM